MLNAWRRLRGLHLLRMGDDARLYECSTPGGVLGGCTGQPWMVPEAVKMCSTPGGVLGGCTPSGKRGLPRSGSAQRLAAS